MTTLLNLEQSLQNYLLHDDPHIFQQVVGTSKVPAEVRLQIYHHAYRSRLHEALSITYPALEHVIGEEAFEILSNAYIDAYPSQFRSIRWFGHRLASFLMSHSDYRTLPYLSELAFFEWTLASVFDATNGSEVSLEEMQNIPPEAWAKMRFKPHPSIHRLSLSWNVVQLWQLITDEQPLVEPERCDLPVEWILWRSELTTQFVSLPNDEAWALDQMIQQTTFGDICEGLCQWVDEDEAGIQAASLLKGWITAGLITEVIF